MDVKSEIPTYYEWYNELTLGQIDAILRAEYENEVALMKEAEEALTDRSN